MQFWGTGYKNRALLSQRPRDKILPLPLVLVLHSLLCVFCATNLLGRSSFCFPHWRCRLGRSRCLCPANTSGTSTQQTGAGILVLVLNWALAGSTPRKNERHRQEAVRSRGCTDKGKGRENSRHLDRLLEEEAVSRALGHSFSLVNGDMTAFNWLAKMSILQVSHQLIIRFFSCCQLTCCRVLGNELAPWAAGATSPTVSHPVLLLRAGASTLPACRTVTSSEKETREREDEAGSHAHPSEVGSLPAGLWAPRKVLSHCYPNRVPLVPATSRQP